MQAATGRVAGFRVAQLVPGLGPAHARRLLDAIEQSTDPQAALDTFTPPRAAAADWADLRALLRWLHTQPREAWAEELPAVLSWYRPHLHRLHEVDAAVREADLTQLARLATQHGTQRHAFPNFNRVREAIRDGAPAERRAPDEVDAGVGARDPGVVDAERTGGATAQDQRQLAAFEHLGSAVPFHAQAAGLVDAHARFELRGGSVGIAAGQQVDVHRLHAAAQVHFIEVAQPGAGFPGEFLEDLAGDQGLVVAGVVDQAGGHVDGVAEAIATDLDHLTRGHRHLQLQPGRGIDLAAVRGGGPGRGLGQGFVHLDRGHDRRAHMRKDGHQAVSEGLDQLAANGRHAARQRRDRARHQCRGLGVAQVLVERGAAPEVGEENDATLDRGHVGRVYRVAGATAVTAHGP